MICRQTRWAPSPIGLIYAHISKKLSQTKNLPDTAYEAPPNARNHRKIGVSSAVVTSNREDVCIDEPARGEGTSGDSACGVAMSASAELWPWLALAGLGLFHGVNPAMGWLFAVGQIGRA